MSKKPVAPTAAAPVMKRANFFFSQDQLAGLDKVAQQKGGTASEHLRKALASYLKRHKVA